VNGDDGAQAGRGVGAEDHLLMVVEIGMVEQLHGFLLIFSF